MDRYSSLQARHNALLKDYEDLARTTRKAKDLQDDNLQLQNKLSSTGKSLQETERKLANVNSHLEFANTTCSLLSRKVAELEEKLDAAREKEAETARQSNNSAARIDLHIPVYNNDVADKILAYPQGTSEVECYSEPSLGINCLHVNVILNGTNISASNQRVKKRAARLSTAGPPDAQHQRNF
jgi:DNA repair exonuclease SbcCD ATPase subunit